MRSTEFIMNVKKEMGDQPLVGAEIGVYRGEHAELMLQHLNMKKLYLIDPYVDNDPDFEGHMKPLVPAAKGIAHERLKDYDQVVWIEEKSDIALSDIQDLLDFVYIDGNHSYKYVMRDIMYYGSIVRHNGWLGGHDYTTRKSPLIEVMEAVDDYGYHADLFPDIGDGKFPDWWFRKRVPF